jgi:outer membrane protein TolC
VPQTLPDLPPLPSTGLPAELVRRRPDVRAAERRVQAADRDVWVAIAEQFPRLGLTVGAETSAQELRYLFDNWLASMAANVAAPLFDAGLRRAEVRRRRAVLSERLNGYGGAVLRAVREVEDALVRQVRQAEYVRSLTRQRELSRQAAEQTRQRYIKGSEDFIRYLTTVLSYQRLQRTTLQARLDLVLYRIELYRALAGGWPLEPPPGAAGAAGSPARPPASPPAAGRDDDQPASGKDRP